MNAAYGRNNPRSLIEQSKNALSAFRMPTGQLLANEVWMVMAMLAQCFKSWLCLLAVRIDKLSWEWKRFLYLCRSPVCPRVARRAGRQGYGTLYT